MQGCPAFPLLTALLPLSPVLYLAIQFCFAPLRDVSDFGGRTCLSRCCNSHKMCRFRMKPNLKIKLDCMYFFFLMSHGFKELKVETFNSPRWLNHNIHVSNTGQAPTCDFSHLIFFFPQLDLSYQMPWMISWLQLL